MLEPDIPHNKGFQILNDNSVLRVLAADGLFYTNGPAEYTFTPLIHL